MTPDAIERIVDLVIGISLVFALAAWVLRALTPDEWEE